MKQILNINLHTLIHDIRGQKVMLDHDLAQLYGVETSALNRAVKRNKTRFPSDFMFQIDGLEAENLRCQVGISSFNSYGGRRYTPFAFTELGIAMLSSVLRSEQAVQVNISIMRTLFKLREMIKSENNADAKIEELAKNSNELFKIVFERMDRIEKNTPLLSPHRRKIGV